MTRVCWSKGNALMPTDSRRRLRLRLAASILIGLWGTSGVSLGQTFELLKSFVPAPNGQYPQAGLIQASDGSLYGTTYSGGAWGSGTVFKMDAAGTLTTLHSFTGSDGAQPYAGLIQASDGNFYGTTSSRGVKMDAAGTLTTLHSFTGSDGAQPFAGLIQASDGNFYGTTSSTVFKMDAAGTLTTLHSFTGFDSARLYAGLIQASDGSFYGTTYDGGGSE